MEEMRTVYRSTLFTILRQLDDLEAQGLPLSAMPHKQRVTFRVDIFAALVPWLDQLLPQARREQVCGKLMRFACRYGPVWPSLLVEFLTNQIGRAGIERWIEDHAPNWAVTLNGDGAVDRVQMLVLPKNRPVRNQALFITVLDASGVVNEN